MVTRKLKAVGTVAAVTVLAGTLAACGGPADAEPAPAAPGDVAAAPADPAEVEGTIRVRWWGGDARQANQLEAIELFESLHPGITVIPEPSAMDGYLDSLTVEMAARNAPDVMALGGSWPLDFGSLGGLLNVLELPGLDMTPFEGTLTDATIGDEVFAVPRGANAWGIMVNLDLFEEAGVEVPDDDSWTWEDFAAAAEQISANTPDGVFGAEMRPQDLLGAFAGQRDGVGLFGADGEIAVPDETLIAYFELFRGLQDSGASPEATLASEIANVGPEETLFGQGRAAMVFLASNQLGALAEASGANVDVLRIPSESEFGYVGTVILPSQWWGVAANTSYPEAAALFVDFMVNSAEAALIMGPDPGNPINDSVAAALIPTLDENAQRMVDFVARVAEHAEAGIPWPPGSGEQSAITQRMVEEVLFGRLTAEAAAAQWRVEVQGALDAGAVD